MLFNSFSFLVFLLLVLFFYYLVPNRGRNYILLLSSYSFYGLWNWKFLGLIIITTITSFYCGIYLGNKKINLIQKKALLIFCLILNLGILSFFKYFNFFIYSLNELSTLLGLGKIPLFIEVLLPVGISFYTFQAISYVIDIYRNQIPPSRNISNFALYISFFPQLVAGPIERFKNLMPQIEQARTVSLDQLKAGFFYILWGYYLKVVIADNCAIIANCVFDSPEYYTGFSLFLGVFAFSLQVYGDFGGYTFIALGVSKLFGINLMINFKRPYFVTNPREFWSRWHISLSNWLKHYLYIPLGGNRKGILRMHINLMITMVLGGLWHGASLNFVFWGTYHGILLCLYHYSNKYNFFSNTPKLLRWLGFLLIVGFSWVLFRIDNTDDFLMFIKKLPFFIFEKSYLLTFVIKPLLFIFLITIPFWIIEIISERNEQGTNYFIKNGSLLRGFSMSVLLMFILIFGNFSEYEFIYFQF